MSESAADLSAPFHPVPQPVLERSMRLNIAAGVLGMGWISVALGMPLPLLMQAVNATGFQLGLLSAAWQFAMLAQIPSVLAVSTWTHRKPFWFWVSIPHRLLWLIPAALPLLLPHRKDWWPVLIILALAISNVLGQAGTGPWQSWMADLLPPQRAGRFWGVRHRFLSASMVVAAFCYGLILDRFSSPQSPYLGFQIVFALGALLGVADIVVHFAVAEPAQAPCSPEAGGWNQVLASLRNPRFRNVTWAMGVWCGAQAMLGYTMGLPGFFSMVYLKEAFGASYAQASWIFIASALGAVLWTARIGHWLDRYGPFRVTRWLMTAGPAFMLAWLFARQGALPVAGFGAIPQAVAVVCAASLFLGGCCAGMWVCQVRLTQEVTSPVGRTVSMGVHWSLVGLIASMGPLAAGWIKDHAALWLAALHLPPSTPYFHALVVLHALLAWGAGLPLLRKAERTRLNGVSW